MGSDHPNMWVSYEQIRLTELKYGNDAIEDSDPIKGSHEIKGSEAIKGSNAIKGSEAIKGSNAIKGSDPMKESDPTKGGSDDDIVDEYVAMMHFREQEKSARENADMDIEEFELRRDEIEKIPVKGYDFTRKGVEQRKRCVSALLEAVELEKLRYRRGENPRPRSDVANDYREAWLRAKYGTTQGNKRTWSNDDHNNRIGNKTIERNKRTKSNDDDDNDDLIVVIPQRTKTKKKKKTIHPPPLRITAPRQPQQQQRQVPVVIEDLIAKYNGTDLMWLTEKKLEVSDTNPNQGRFFFPRCEVWETYLTNKEKWRIYGPGGNREGLSAMVVDSEGGTSHLQFKFRRCLKNHVFTTNWNFLVSKLGLIERIHKVHIWCFRLPPQSGSKLCFAIEKSEIV